MQTPPYLTTQDVADRFHVSTSTVTRWVRLGILPATRLPGVRSHLRFNQADVDNFEDAHLKATA